MNEWFHKTKVIAFLGTLIMHCHLNGQYFQTTDILSNTRSYKILSLANVSREFSQ